MQIKPIAIPKVAIPEVHIPYGVIRGAWTEALIVPIADLQLGAQGACPKKLREHIEWTLGHPNPWYLLLGDPVDFLSPSNQQRLRAAGLYDSGEDIIESRAAQSLVDEFVHLMRGTEGRWLGVTHGHHRYRFRDGTTTDTRIAKALKAPYLGTCAYVGMQFRRRPLEVITYTIACHHGCGSGAKNAAPLNKIENWLPTVRGADLVLIGHYTRKPTTDMQAIYPNWKPRIPKIEDQHIRFGCVGGWHRGYTQGSKVGPNPEGSYVEKALMPATAIGAPVYYVGPVHAEKRDYFETKELK